MAGHVWWCLHGGGMVVLLPHGTKAPLRGRQPLQGTARMEWWAWREEVIS